MLWRQRSIAGAFQEHRLPACLAGGLRFAQYIRAEEAFSGFNAQGQSDLRIGFRFLLRSLSRFGIEVGREEAGEITLLGVLEDQPLRLPAAARKDRHTFASGHPLSHGGWGVLKHLAFELATLIAVFPELSLKIFQRWHFPVFGNPLLGQPKDFLLGSRCIERHLILLALLLVVPGYLCQLITSSFHPGCDSTGSIRKQLVLHEGNGCGGSLNIQQHH
mmetsp:Transcript_37323/g.58979  ORF Transcript_37323/g.58979 Transcript_37323/m.58979 type:complete len:218 (+) Transcript_37323:75-728(+)